MSIKHDPPRVMKPDETMSFEFHQKTAKLSTDSQLFPPIPINHSILNPSLTTVTGSKNLLSPSKHIKLEIGRMGEWDKVGRGTRQ